MISLSSFLLSVVAVSFAPCGRLQEQLALLHGAMLVSCVYRNCCVGSHSIMPLIHMPVDHKE
jgi:hypothetical protein